MICTENDCNKYACFGLSGEKAIACKVHCKPGMIDVEHKSCAIEGCKTRPSYNFIGEKIGMYCVTHKKDDMVNVIDKKCKFDGCRKRPQFNYSDQKIGIYCVTHKKDDMVNVKSKKCAFQDCQKNAIWGEKFGVAVFCVKHKKDDMVCVNRTICKDTNCDKTAVYNYRGETADWCRDHKQPNMVSDPKSKNCCIVTDCFIRPCYNYEDKEIPEYCASHKKDNMIDVTHKTCEHEDCYKQPNFNYPGEKFGRFCLQHSDDGMIDVRNFICQIKNCTKRARFGFPGQNPINCATHKQKGTLAFPSKRCIIKSCLELALFGIKTREHCETHKEDHEFNLLEKKCISCGHINILDENEKCQYCDPDTFNRVRLFKQNTVVEFLRIKNVKFESVDRIVEKGVCGKDRPDIHIDTGTHKIVVEVDEDQHKSKNGCDETNRMKNVSSSFGMQTLFIRYNPDKYRVNKVYDEHVGRNKRLEKLLETIEYFQDKDNRPKEFLEVYHLFFDNYDMNEKIKTEVLMRYGS